MKKRTPHGRWMYIPKELFEAMHCDTDRPSTTSVQNWAKHWLYTLYIPKLQARAFPELQEPDVFVEDKR
jgi:hypothetical protein